METCRSDIVDRGPAARPLLTVLAGACMATSFDNPEWLPARRAGTAFVPSEMPGGQGVGI
jgi:hypothetical protein